MEPADAKRPSQLSDIDLNKTQLDEKIMCMFVKIFLDDTRECRQCIEIELLEICCTPF